MPAISFQRAFLNALLRGDKQQTTRKQTARIKVGDTAQIYIEQRAPITGKPTRRMSELGREMIHQKRTIPYDIRTYPPVHPDTWIRGIYYAHFLGIVQITDVYDVLPINSCGKDAWAKHDGFDDFAAADKWFEDKYGEKWMCKHWTVIRWDGWMERYFEPKP